MSRMVTTSHCHHLHGYLVPCMKWGQGTSCVAAAAFASCWDFEQVNTDSLHFLIRKTGVMHTAIVTRKAESEFNILISVLISISSWVSLYSLGRRTQLNAHTQMPFYSTGAALTTFPFCWDLPVPRYWEKLLPLLPYGLTQYLGRDVRAGRSWGCEALSPAPSSGLAPGTLRWVVWPNRCLAREDSSGAAFL